MEHFCKNFTDKFVKNILHIKMTKKYCLHAEENKLAPIYYFTMPEAEIVYFKY